MHYSYKKIVLINLPVMMSVLVEQLINITDALFLGRLGETELGASAIAGIYYLSLYMIGFGFSLGLQVVIARRNGEGHLNETGRTFFQGLWTLSLLALLLYTFSEVCSPYLLRCLVTSDEVYGAVMDYLRPRSYGLLFIFPALAFRSFFVGITRTVILTSSALMMIGANIGLNYLLIFGKFGFPQLGILGAGIASSASEALSLLLFIGYSVFKLNRTRYGFNAVFDLNVLLGILKISVWSMMHSFLSMAPWLLFFISIEHLGKSQLAVGNIIRSISSLFFVIVSSLGSTTAALVSNLIGSGNSREVKGLCKKVIRLGYGMGIPLILLALLFHENILSLYTYDSGLLTLAFAPYVVMLLNYLFALPAYVMLNVVTGTGATRKTFLFQLITILCYLFYLGLLNRLDSVPLSVYWTVEYLFVILLGMMSMFYIRKWMKTQSGTKSVSQTDRTVS